MRSVKKDFDNPPDILQSEGCQQKIKHALHEQNQHYFSQYYYGHPNKVRQNLETLYQYKCAYCETKVTGSVLRVDHFRPKVSNQRRGHAYWLLLARLRME